MIKNLLLHKIITFKSAIFFPYKPQKKRQQNVFQQIQQ